MTTGIHSFRPNPGSTHKTKRIGRGPGSGHGKTAGRGEKGFWSRSGSHSKRGFEGGQMPLHRRLPKRGFSNDAFKKESTSINVCDLEKFEIGSKLGPQELIAAGLVRKVAQARFARSWRRPDRSGTARHGALLYRNRSGKDHQGGRLLRGYHPVIEAIKNIFNVPDLRKRLLFMLALLAVYRIGAFIPTPGIDANALDQFFTQNQGTVFGMLDMFSGGNFRRLTIFALGIMPYITASIILQLLTVVWPHLEKLSKEGDLGRRKITTYTRYLTVVLSLVQSLGIGLALQRSGTFVINPGIGFLMMTMLTLTTGSAFIMWLGEQISDRGIGNGMSLIIFAGIVVRLPSAIASVYDKLSTNEWSVLTLLILIVFMVAVVAFIIFVERGTRRISVQYAKRVVGRRVLGGQSTHLPLRVNSGGVMPVIFASSILTFPQTFGMFTQNVYLRKITDNLGFGDPLYNLLYLVAIIFFAYFYTSIIFNPNEIADNMRKFGGFIPGIRPGKRTADYVNTILTRITVVGALYLAIIAIMPEFLYTGFHAQKIPWIGPRLDAALPQWMTQGLHVNFLFGGTSLLIVIGVAMDTIQMIESQLVMRLYDGFMKKSRVRGRRS